MANFDWPRGLQRHYAARLGEVVTLTTRRLRALEREKPTPAQFRDRARRIGRDVVRETAKVIAEGYADIMVARVNRELAQARYDAPKHLRRGFRRIPKRTRDEVARQQRGVVKALVEHAVEDAIRQYNLGEGFNTKRQRSRAKFYAQDQTGQTFNRLTKEFSGGDTGSVGYIWVRTTSKNPRDFHLDRVDYFFKWGQVKDEPGILPNCKCTARPVWEAPKGHKTWRND